MKLPAWRPWTPLGVGGSKIFPGQSVQTCILGRPYGGASQISPSKTPVSETLLSPLIDRILLTTKRNDTDKMTKCRLAPAVKHRPTGQESGGELCEILIVSAVKICKQCLQTGLCS